MRVNDYVTRSKYNHDIVFRIVKIENNIAYLRGEVLRLIADAELSDLKLTRGNPKIDYDMSVYQRTKQGYVNGRILHLDGDEYYLKKAMNFYQQANVSCIGYYIEESQLPEMILPLLEKHHPDIIVITGHDAYDGKDIEKLSSYRSSKFFIDAIRKARQYQSSKDSLCIIAGACQSNFELLMDAGANFASSPTRRNIHLLDPVIIATDVALIPVEKRVDPQFLIKKTMTKALGGIESYGTSRRIYIGGT